MSGIEYSFQKLMVWQASKTLVVAVYNLLDRFPKFEKYALCDQIRRAVVSVPSNIAEGSGRISLREKIHFLEISYGSLMETFNQLLIAVELSYITEESVEAVKPTIDEVARMINGLRNNYLSQLEEKNPTKNS